MHHFKIANGIIFTFLAFMAILMVFYLPLVFNNQPASEKDAAIIDTCKEVVTGNIALSDTSFDNKTSIQLIYKSGPDADTKEIITTGNSYSFEIIGQPDPNFTWQLQAFHTQGDGQIIDQTNDINNIGCNGTAYVDIEI